MQQPALAVYFCSYEFVPPGGGFIERHRVNQVDRAFGETNLDQVCTLRVAETACSFSVDGEGVCVLL